LSSLLSKNVNIKKYKTLLLPVVLYECETLSLTLKKKQRLRMFANRVLRRVFGLWWEVLTRGWRGLHNELHNWFSSPSIIRMIMSRKMRLEGHVARMGRPEIHTGHWWESQKEMSTRCRCVDNIKMDLENTGFGGTN
jgi:hypothetical protein